MDMSSDETVEHIVDTSSPRLKHPASGPLQRYNKRRKQSGGTNSYVHSDDGCENLIVTESLVENASSAENLYFELGEQMKLLSHERSSLRLEAKRPVDSFEYFSASTNVSTEMRKGDDHLQNKNYGFAIDSYEKAASMEEDNKHVYFRLGKAHLDNQKPEKAIPFFKKALQLDQVDKHTAMSNAPTLFLYLGACYLTLYRFSDAVKCYQHALLRNPFCVYSRIGLGRALKAQNQLETSIHHFKLAVHIEPTSESALECLAMAEYEFNDYTSSLKHLQMLLAVSPSHFEAKRLVDWIQSTRSSQMGPPRSSHRNDLSTASGSSTIDVEDHAQSRARQRSNRMANDNSGVPTWLSGTNTESAYTALMSSWNDCIQTLGSTTDEHKK